MTGSLLLDIDGAAVKNDQTLSFPVPTECADLIRLYLHKYHSRLTPGANPYLFPSDVPGYGRNAPIRLVNSSPS
jgi:hypothetical protein